MNIPWSYSKVLVGRLVILSLLVLINTLTPLNPLQTGQTSQLKLLIMRLWVYNMTVQMDKSLLETLQVKLGLTPGMGEQLDSTVMVDPTHAGVGFGINTGVPGVLVNYGQRSFVYDLPSGYKPLQTNNLNEPTVKKGNENFGILTYSASGSLILPNYYRW